MTPSPSARQFLRTLTLVAISIGVLFAIDTFLAKTEHSEDRAEATRLFQEGQRLLDQGDGRQAEERFKDALAIERGNRDYQLALAQAQLIANQPASAETTLTTLLAADSTAGPPNLAMARVLAKENRVREAVAYYHRAIFGQWKNDPDRNRLGARFELIDLLAGQHSKEELLAELLAVQDQAPSDVATRLRMGQLFLTAGSPARAAGVFRQVLKEEPNNAGAYAGIGQADLAREDYRGAATDFFYASKLNPQDQNSRKKLELSNQILDLDPTRRGLAVPERFRRSHELLQMTLDAATKCFGANPPQVLQQLLGEAQKATQERALPARQDQLAEADLDLAEKLESARKSACGAVAGDDALALLLAKISPQ